MFLPSPSPALFCWSVCQLLILLLFAPALSGDTPSINKVRAKAKFARTEARKALMRKHDEGFELKIRQECEVRIQQTSSQSVRAD
jgi:hypothetical protein